MQHPDTLGANVQHKQRQGYHTAAVAAAPGNLLAQPLQGFQLAVSSAVPALPPKNWTAEPFRQAVLPLEDRIKFVKGPVLTSAQQALASGSRLYNFKVVDWSFVQAHPWLHSISRSAVVVRSS